MAEAYPKLLSLPRHAHPSATLLRTGADLVGIQVQDRHRRLVAVGDIARGTLVFRLEGRESPKPTRYSVQVGPGLHLDPDFGRDEFEMVQKYFWRYLDHACEPTVRIIGRDVIALRDIAEDEGVTFHYCTTEYDMATPFDCRCGSPHCMGRIRGARHLTPVQRRRLAKWMADYLK